MSRKEEMHLVGAYSEISHHNIPKLNHLLLRREETSITEPCQVFQFFMVTVRTFGGFLASSSLLTVWATPHIMAILAWSVNMIGIDIKHYVRS